MSKPIQISPITVQENSLVEIEKFYSKIAMGLFAETFKEQLYFKQTRGAGNITAYILYKKTAKC